MKYDNIPYYQRPYRWDEKRIQNLIDDFYKNKKENENAEYFVGSVVLVEDPEIANKYDIIEYSAVVRPPIWTSGTARP